jgi:Phosphoketolase
LIHRLTYRRTNHDNIHVRGYKEEGTITTPFDQYIGKYGEDLPEIRYWKWGATNAGKPA